MNPSILDTETQRFESFGGGLHGRNDSRRRKTENAPRLRTRGARNRGHLKTVLYAESEGMQVQIALIGYRIAADVHGHLFLAHIHIQVFGP